MRQLHSWNLSYQEAIKLQNQLASSVLMEPIAKEPRLIAGIDCALAEDKQKIISCAVVLSYPELALIEVKSAVRKLTMAYIPGLLSFREAPACLEAVEKLEHNPDLYIVDGQGIAHPRRLGLAAHLGLFFDAPTIGCAKSRLTGQYDLPANQRGAYSLLRDGNDTIGAVVRTRTHVKPLFVSVGHRCTLQDAIKWILNCAIKYRLPEPTRLADKYVNRIKKGDETCCEILQRCRKDPQRWLIPPVSSD